jgi:hypothetical protein
VVKEDVIQSSSFGPNDIIAAQKGACSLSDPIFNSSLGRHSGVGEEITEDEGRNKEKKATVHQDS